MPIYIERYLDTDHLPKVPVLNNNRMEKYAQINLNAKFIIPRVHSVDSTSAEPASVEPTSSASASI